MSLSLLAPLALLGAALVVVPVLLHLIDQRRVPRIDFPAIRFLILARQRMRKRRRIRDPWLLFLRVLALLFLVAAFANAVVHYTSQVPAGAELSGNVVFLLDRSMSMRYEIDGQSLFERARMRASEVLEALPQGARAGLILFDSVPEDRAGGLSPDLDKIAKELKKAEPGYKETDLRNALLAGLRVLLATPEGSGDLYLLSDMTRASLGGAASYDLPEQLEGKVRLIVSELDEAPRSNRAVVGIEASRVGGEGGKVKIQANLSAQGPDSGGEVPVDLGLEGEILSRGFASLTPDSTSEKLFTLPSQADPSGEGVVRLGKDALEADNQYFFRMQNRRDLRALVIDGEPGEYLTSAESFFVERALNPKKASGSRITPVVVGEGDVGRLDPQEYAVVFLLNVANPKAYRQRLENYVKAGGGLFISVGNRVRPEVYNRLFSSLTPASIGPIKATSIELTGQKPPALAYPEVGHPIFQVFREAGASVFSTVSFYKMVPTAPTLKPGAEVLLKYANGLPALLGRSVGYGRVLLFTSTLDREWNDFPMKSIFLPFIQECSHYLARNPTGEDHGSLYIVGQPVSIEVTGGTGALSVADPTGQEIKLEPPERLHEGETSQSRRAILRDARVPGHYRVLERKAQSDEAVPRPDLAFAVNISARESDLARMNLEELKSRISSLPVVLEGQAETAGVVEVERKQPLNLPFLWIFLGLLLLEGLVAAVKQRLASGEGEA